MKHRDSNGTSGARELSCPAPRRGLGPFHVCDWPDEVVAECVLILRAMRPRHLVGLYVPNSDFAGSLIPHLEIAEGLRSAISRVTGGLTKYRHGLGDYCPPEAPWLNERTVVLESFLPLSFSDERRMQLIWLFLDFGRHARQDVVQVQVGFRGFWIPTGMFREPAAASSSNSAGEGGLVAG
jgi:hypothetical protein